MVASAPDSRSPDDPSTFRVHANYVVWSVRTLPRLVCWSDRYWQRRHSRLYQSCARWPTIQSVKSGTTSLRLRRTTSVSSSVSLRIIQVCIWSVSHSLPPSRQTVYSLPPHSARTLQAAPGWLGPCCHKLRAPNKGNRRTPPCRCPARNAKLCGSRGRTGPAGTDCGTARTCPLCDSCKTPHVTSRSSPSHIMLQLRSSCLGIREC